MLFKVKGRHVHKNRWMIVAATVSHALPAGGGHEAYRVAMDPDGTIFVKVATDVAAHCLRDKFFQNETDPDMSVDFDTVWFIPVDHSDLYREEEDEARKLIFRRAV